MTIRNLSFNQSGSHLTVTTDKGFIIFALNPTIERKHVRSMNGGVNIMKMLNKSNLIAIAGGYKPDNYMILWNDIINKPIINVDVKKQIKNLAIMNEKIVVVLEREICVFNFKGEVVATHATYSNKNGICIINNDESNPTIITLGLEKGEVGIWKLNHDSYVTIKAHNNTHNIETIALNKNSTLIASASECGKLINVFNLETHELVQQFRRGTTSTRICDLAFSNNSEFLACCSSNGTIHIFGLNNSETTNTKSVLTGWVSEDYLPSYFGSEWSFQQHKIGYSSAKMICCFDDKDTLHVATIEEKYYKIFGDKYQNIKSNDLQCSIE